jgi:hypothetical protein
MPATSLVSATSARKRILIASEVPFKMYSSHKSNRRVQNDAHFRCNGQPHGANAMPRVYHFSPPCNPIPLPV